MPKCREGEQRAAAVLPGAGRGRAWQRAAQPRHGGVAAASGQGRRGRKNVAGAVLSQARRHVCQLHRVCMRCADRSGRETASHSNRGQAPGLLPSTVLLFVCMRHGFTQTDSGQMVFRSVKEYAAAPPRYFRPSINQRRIAGSSGRVALAIQSVDGASINTLFHAGSNGGRRRPHPNQPDGWRRRAGARQPRPPTALQIQPQPEPQEKECWGEHSHAGADPCFLLRVWAAANLGVWELASRAPICQASRPCHKDSAQWQHKHAYKRRAARAAAQGTD